ncbi:MAG: DUF3131 domain-containing protein, partial [Oscillochloris sp.]|nr:DUF3131 domain-containing protein [Oscillochloris sp.]
MQQRRWLRPLAALFMALALLGAVPGAVGASHRGGEDLSARQRAALRQYAADTWQSFVAMVDLTSGLPADNIDADTRARSAYTSPTNIGAYIWATLAARDLQIITPDEARARIDQTLASLATLERHQGSGQFYNWYDPSTGAKLTVWPADGSTVYPFLSSVDNGWLAAALIMVTNSVPQLRGEAQTIVDSMDFSCYYDPVEGLLRGGFWDTNPPPGTWPVGNYCHSGPDVSYTGHHYGTLNTEPRIASYIGIAKDGIPASHYFKMWRTFPDSCDWSWAETDPDGVTRTYLGVPVYEGHYSYRSMDIVPSWGGSMFEALMVPLLVPEEQWGPRSWGVNHPLYVEAQIEHGMDEAGYGYWGFSPASDPAGGYREYGVDQIGMEPNGYASDEQRTLIDMGFKDPSGQGYCPGREPQPLPADYGDGVVTPHASFLALDFAPDAAMANLAKLRANFDAYGWGGFYDSVDVEDGQVARRYLALDQGMVIVAIGNELRNDRLQSYFTRGEIEQAIRPLLRMEQFT